MNNKNLSALYSWPVIIIAFCVFWPVGVYLLVKRIGADRQTAMTAGKITKGIAYFLLGFTGIGFLACLADDALDGSVIFVLILFGAGGIYMLKKSKNIIAQAERTKRYISVVINGNARQIDTIASSVGVSYDVARHDIQKMIDQGYFKNAYINEGTRELVIPEAAPRSTVGSFFSNMAANATQTQNAPQPRVVTCPCCGANNTIVGAVGECEYCGGPLK